MKKNSGFSSFEFYFVMAVIGIVVLVGLQRYLQLGEETQRLSFQVVAQHFNAAVYNFHAKWIVASQMPNAQKVIEVSDNKKIHSNEHGWPMGLAIGDEDHSSQTISLSGCHDLWKTLLQNPPAISYAGGDAYGSRPYHLSLTLGNSCRYEFITSKREEYYFDYSPKDGQVTFHTPANK